MKHLFMAVVFLWSTTAFAFGQQQARFTVMGIGDSIT